MEQISTETEEDLQGLVTVLESFGVTVIRTEISDNFNIYKLGDRYLPPPLTPRDDTAIIGTQFFMPTPTRYTKWNALRGSDWPDSPPATIEEWNNLSDQIRDELTNVYRVYSLDKLYDRDHTSLKSIQELVLLQGNHITYDKKIDSAMVSRIGKDLYFGTWNLGQDHHLLKHQMEQMFPDYRCHVIDTGGHLDGTFCPVKPGLIISSHDVVPEVFAKHFPGWEVVYADRTHSKPTDSFLLLKQKNAGKWWVPGEEANDKFTDYVQSYFDNWMGNIQETTIDVNLLVIDEQNVLCITEDKKVFEAFTRHNITPHVVNFRHFRFWDSGLHCVTSDLHRTGTLQDYFPERA